MKPAIFALCLCAVPAPLVAQAAWTTVTYLSGTSVYVDAGTKNGLKEGSRLQVIRGGEPIADLVVAFISSTRASCTVERSSAAPAVGDSVRYTAIRPSVQPESAQGAAGAGGSDCDIWWLIPVPAPEAS